jgi:hypothetical protein
MRRASDRGTGQGRWVGSVPAGGLGSGGSADAAGLGGEPPAGPFEAGSFESGSFESGVVLGAGGDEGHRPYRVRAPHPLAQLATRAALWGAVVLGAVGGVVGLVRPPVQQVEAVADGGLEQGSVPAPVAGIAELVVETWLTADDDDEDRAVLADLFIDPPLQDETHLAALRIEHVVTVAGEQRAAGYWAVTVAVDVVEEVAVEGEGPEGEQAIEQLRATWYLEVAIVGEVDGRLVALSTPAVVPAPAGAVADWRASIDTPREPGDDALAETVEGFLAALLAEGGDPSRYLAPGGEIEAIDPAPFVAVELVAMTAEDYQDGQTRVLADILVTTPGGTRTRLTYELMLGEWADRWEITRFSGAPSVVVAPVPEDDDEPADDDEPTDDDEPADDDDAGEPTGTTAPGARGS